MSHGRRLRPPTADSPRARAPLGDRPHEACTKSLKNSSKLIDSPIGRTIRTYAVKLIVPISHTEGVCLGKWSLMERFEH